MGIDKLYHLIAGFIIQLLFGFTWVIIAALAKEWYDEYKYGGWDWMDILFTLFGALIGITLFK